MKSHTEDKSESTREKKGSTSDIQKSFNVVDDEKSSRDAKLLLELDRLTKKGVIFSKRFISDTGNFGAGIEETQHTVTIVVKNPQINKKPDKPTNKFQYRHYSKSGLEPTAACNEFIGAVLAEFLYPGEAIAPKNRLVVGKITSGVASIGITSKSLDNTTRMDKGLLKINHSSYHTAEEFGVNISSLCKAMVIADFIGLTDNNEGNIRKTLEGKVIRIDFEAINFAAASSAITIEKRPSKNKSMVDPGICYTDEYIREVEKIAKLNQKNLDLVFDKVEKIVSMYGEYFNEKNWGQSYKECYINRIQQMGEYAQVLRKEQTRRQRLAPLEYIKTCYAEMGMGIPGNSNANYSRDPYRAAEWIMQQAEKYKDRGVSLNDITKSCLGLEDNAKIDQFEFQMLFILNARNSPDVKLLIDMAKINMKRNNCPPPLFEMTAKGFEDYETPIHKLYKKDIALQSLKCPVKEIVGVLDKMYEQLQEMGVKNPLFPSEASGASGFIPYIGTFNDFKNQCAEHYTQYQRAVQEGYGVENRASAQPEFKPVLK